LDSENLAALHEAGSTPEPPTNESEGEVIDRLFTEINIGAGGEVAMMLQHTRLPAMMRGGTRARRSRRPLAE